MIRLGLPSVSIIQQKGIIIENNGGIITFHGRCFLGAGSAISVGPNGHLDIGDNVHASATARIVCYHHITLENNVHFGWECLLMDTDLHALTKRDGTLSRGYAPIHIGQYTWLGNGCCIMKRTTIPEKCVVQAGTTLSEPVDVPPCSIIGHEHKIIARATGLYRNPDNDDIQYPPLEE